MRRTLVCIAGGLGLLTVGCATDRETAQRTEVYAAHVGAGADRTLPDLGSDATLDDYIQYALLNNPGVEAAYQRWRAAVERVPQARTLPDPRLTYARYIQEVETRVGPQENRLGVQQTLPWFGKLGAKANRAMDRAETERWRFEQAKLALQFRVTDAYAEYYYLGRATLITEENLALMRHFEEVARRRYEVGKATYSDVVKAQVELGTLSDRVRTLEARRPALGSALNTELNRPATTPLPWPRTPEEPRTAYDAPAIRARLREANPELLALSGEIAAAVDDLELTRLRYYPDVTVGVDWIDTGSALMPTPDSGKDPVMASISVNIPLWYESYRAAEREAEATLSAAAHAREERHNTLANRLELAIFRYDDARRKISLFRDTLVPKAQQSLQATETAFTTGAGDFLQLLDAQRILLEFQLSAERALTDSVQRDAEIRALLGNNDSVSIAATSTDPVDPTPEPQD